MQNIHESNQPWMKKLEIKPHHRHTDHQQGPSGFKFQSEQLRNQIKTRAKKMNQSKSRREADEVADWGNCRHWGYQKAA